MKKTIIICAWCPDKKKKEREATKKGFDYSHGICEKCVNKLD